MKWTILLFIQNDRSWCECVSVCERARAYGVCGSQVNFVSLFAIAALSAVLGPAFLCVE